METAVLNAGQGSDTVNLYATHREQDVLGGHSATFTVNAGGGDDTVNVGAPLGGGFTLAGFAIDLEPPTVTSPKGIPVMINGQGGTDVIHYLDSAATANTDLAFTKKTFAELFPADPNDPTDPTDPSDYWLAQFTAIFGEDPESTPYATVVLSETGQAKPININARRTEHVEVSLGSGSDVIQMTDGVYDFDITVYAGAGRDTFNIEDNVDNRGYVMTLNGEEDDDIVFAQFEDNVPNGTVRLAFNGGPQDGVNGGDMLRVAGNGLATGTYTPSSTVARAGRVDVRGNLFDFTGVEPLVVHGLSDFDVVTPDDDADLAIDSINVLDLELENLVLHVVTVDGAISWTQQAKLTVPDALEVKQVGRAVAMSGNTLVVGAALDGASYGVVYVYTWNGSTWVEQGKLYPSDRGGAGKASASRWRSTAIC